MPTIIQLHQLEDLSEGKGEILLETEINTELHIIRRGHDTIIKFPYGNRFDVIDGNIIIKPVKK